VLARKALAELLGSMFLTMAVVGSGIVADHLTQNQAIALLANSLVTGAALVALILALQPVSAAFNPLVTVLERAMGTITTRAAAVFIAAQFVGCLAGVALANLMFDLPAFEESGNSRDGGGIWLGEVIATFGLLVVVFGVIRSGRINSVAFAVGGYITAAYWFTSSTSFANPAITVARMLTDSFSGIAPADVLMFLLMQLIGAALARVAIQLLYPRPAEL
jgi:glycerol uptake facilitator-like aquaporin